MTQFTIQRGDTWAKTLTVTQGGSGVDFGTVAKAWMTFKAKEAKPADTDDSGADAQVTIGSGITVTDAPNGVVAVKLTPSQTRALSKQSYYWDFQIKLSNGDVFTVDKGTATILDEVTVSV